MHKKTTTIIKNLGYGDDVIKVIKGELKNPTGKEPINTLRKFGFPEEAIKQIKSLENLEPTPNKSNAELIDELVKKCKRSFDAFAQKGVATRIIFDQNGWNIFSEQYSKVIQKLQETCAHHFADASNRKLQATIIFDGTPKWKIIAQESTKEK